MNENISMDDDRTWQRETLIAYFDFFLAGGLEALSILRFRRDAWEKSAASAPA